MKQKSCIFPLLLITVCFLAGEMYAASGLRPYSALQDGPPADTLPKGAPGADSIPLLTPVSADSLPGTAVLSADSISLTQDSLGIVPIAGGLENAADTSGAPADTTKGGLEAQILSKAEKSITYYLNDKYTVLRGNAYIEYLDITLNAEYIRINNVKKEIFATGLKDSLGRYYGRPKMVQGGQEITADSLKYNFETRRAFAWNSLTAEGEGYIRGVRVKWMNTGWLISRTGFTRPVPTLLIRTSVSAFIKRK
ncbi:hypothetical protein FRZ59_15975 [Anseongella ginsenosidimutans]|nr:hypothetical protein FRZ59_15975 [Anseongella ginsenosidimutans]